MLLIPDIRQQDEHDCGPACIEAVLEFFHRDTGGDAGLSFAHPIEGMTPDVVCAVLRSFDLNVLCGRLPGGVDALRDFTASGFPVMCPITVDGVGHWVVVRGVQRGRVYFHDPSYRGPRSLPVAEWVKAWHDYTVSGHECAQWGIVVSE